MAEHASVPILTSGKFTGRALKHITKIAHEAAEAVKSDTADSIASKVDRAVLENFIGSLTSTITSSEAKVALASTQAAVAAERAAREEADQALSERVKAVEHAEIDLSDYATKEQLEESLQSRQDRLMIYQGKIELGAMETGRMVGLLAQAPGTIAGHDVAPGQVWVFVCDGSAWTGYLAGGSGGSGSGGGGNGGPVAGARPAPKASQVSDRTARITWPEVAGATGYELRVNSAAADTVTSPHDLAGLSPDSNVMVEVRAILPAGPTAWGQVTFRTSSAPMASLALRGVGASAADTITIFATEAENDSARGKNVQWGGHAQTVKRLPGNGSVEFTMPRAATGSIRAILTEGRGNGFIGVNWTADGMLTRQGGKYAGGIAAPEANSSTRFRLGRNDDEWFLDQRQGNSWVRIGSQPRSGERVYLQVNAGAGDNQWEITGVKGSGWA